MSPHMLGSLQQPTSNNKAKFVPSKSLREHIAERIDMQQDCLDLVNERLSELKTLANEGKANSTGKGPGDEQIDGEKMAQIKRQAALMGDPWPSAAQTAAMEKARSDMAAALSTRLRPSRAQRYQTWAFPQQQTQSDTQEEILDEDPLEKYLRLENEIRLLVNMGTVPSKQSNPYQAQADQYENMTKPHKALAKRLPEILGP